MNRHGHSEAYCGPNAHVHRNNGGGFHHHHQPSGVPLLDVCCCGALLCLAFSDPRFASALAITIVAIVIISCLATLAMSVTGETLLSLFLVGMVIAGVAALCKSQRGGCFGPENDEVNPHRMQR